ncbi:MAG: 2Fe-2S iron-sulfur cluster-binding protein [Gammaproteobacteria bacterium]
MPKINLTNRKAEALEVEATSGISVMENIRDLDASVDAICGGLCSCATCHVFIDPEWVAKAGSRSGEEQDLLGHLSSFDPDRSRLSCQIMMSDDLDGLTLTVAPEDF